MYKIAWLTCPGKLGFSNYIEKNCFKKEMRLYPWFQKTIYHNYCRWKSHRRCTVCYEVTGGCLYDHIMSSIKVGTFCDTLHFGFRLAFEPFFPPSAWKEKQQIAKPSQQFFITLLDNPFPARSDYIRAPLNQYNDYIFRFHMARAFIQILTYNVLL